MISVLNHLLLTTKLDSEIAYALIYIVCAASVYMVMVKRAGDEIPRQAIDGIFFLMVGVAAVIWVLSKFAVV
ncbi:MAG: hypothetical protein AAGI38_22910 [Bacteroidota bacterium]